jgi:hypothetical protein
VKILNRINPEKSTPRQHSQSSKKRKNFESSKREMTPFLQGNNPNDSGVFSRNQREQKGMV